MQALPGGSKRSGVDGVVDGVEEEDRVKVQ